MNQTILTFREQLLPACHKMHAAQYPYVHVTQNPAIYTLFSGSNDVGKPTEHTFFTSKSLFTPTSAPTIQRNPLRHSLENT